MAMAAMNMVSAGGFSGVSFHLRRCPQGVASVLCKKNPIFGSRRSKLDHLTVLEETSCQGARTWVVQHLIVWSPLDLAYLSCQNVFRCFSRRMTMFLIEKKIFMRVTVFNRANKGIWSFKQNLIQVERAENHKTYVNSRDMFCGPQRNYLKKASLNRSYFRDVSICSDYLL